MIRTLFVDVILPLPVPNLYTYRVPRDWEDAVQNGCRVIVQFGKKKLYTALIRKIHEKAPEHYQAKYLDSVLDEFPIVNEEQFKLWEWISAYYMCSIGEVMNAALPAGLKLASETMIVPNPVFEGDISTLSPKAIAVLEALNVQNSMSLSEIANMLDQKTTHHLINSLLNSNAVLIEEEVKERYKPKKEDYIRLTPSYKDEEGLKKAFELLRNAPKQEELLMTFIQLSERYRENTSEVKKITLQKRAAATSSTTIQLVNKGIFELYSNEAGRLEVYTDEMKSFQELSEEQQRSFGEIKEQFKTKDVVLLHGVTSSGKTEVYVDLIREALNVGKQVLYLLPEIALTTQIIVRLQRYFGDEVGVYHSRFNQSEKVELWNSLVDEKKQRFKIILGARSALFLPFNNLGLVIVDEEHESSFKQYEPAPRYNARDAAIVLARIHGGKVLLGSATPSVESVFNAREGKYGFSSLTKRYGGVKLPEVLCADIQEEAKRKTLHSHFTSLLLDEIKIALDKKEQVILFQNRRGYSPMWSCETCNWTPQCKKCDVSLTYHKHSHQLVCHYCGSKYNPPLLCSACGSSKLKMLGFGTEKIEEEIPIFFPEAKVARLDLDTTRAKSSYRTILNDFEEGAVDVLIGTQMVTKGLDFSNVSLVGIMNADSMLNFPDFRAYERSFQLMTQVAGRAGRQQKRGKVIIQTYNPNHWIIRKVIEGNFDEMYNQEILERRNYHYPPFFRLIKLNLRHKDVNWLDNAAAIYAEALKNKLGSARVLGPEYPSVSRIRNLYHKNILLKVELGAAVVKTKEIIHNLNAQLLNTADFKSVRLLIDVDPA